jgi:hypothetical protein
MSSIERLTALLASTRLTLEEKQTIQDAIRLIKGFQAARIADYEEKMKGGLDASPATPQALRGAVEEIDGLSQSGFGEIAAMASLSLLALEQPATYSNGCGLDDVADMLTAIWGKAKDMENCINATAEGVGCNSVDAAQRRRWAAQRAANEAKNVGRA